MAFLRQELAIDLGTANTVIFKDDNVVLDEPSIIATDTKTGRLMALGTQAQLMEEHTPPGITTVRPLMNGVIADYDAAEMMLTGFIRKATGRRKSIFAPALRVVIGIPGGSTPVDMRSIRDSASHAGAHDVEMIYEPMAHGTEREHDRGHRGRHDGDRRHLPRRHRGIREHPHRRQRNHH